jgi:hypothetical protein
MRVPIDTDLSDGVNRVKCDPADVFGMTPSTDEHATDGSDSVTFSVTIEGEETVITMRGDRDTAVIVRSASGERIYLPPEDFDRQAPGDGSSHPDVTDSPYQSASTDSPYQGAPTDSPYQSTESSGQPTPTDSPYQRAASDSPYQGVGSDSPYQAAGETTHSEGLSTTADGYRIRHPEPVTDVRVLR